MKFKIHNSEKKPGQKFDKENIHFIKAGKKYNVYELIQEGRTDTEIYPTLEKYGCIDRLKLNAPEIYADVREAKSLRNQMDSVRKAEEAWQNLPLETRKEFNHSKREFIERGEKYLKNIIEQEINAKQQPITNEEKINEQE